jgi:hypothetical protein
MPENFPLDLEERRWREIDLLHRATGLPYSTCSYPHPITPSKLITVHMPVGDFELRALEFSDDERPDERIFGGYFFIANGAITPTPEGVKKLAFRKSDKYAYYCKVQFLTAGPDMTSERFVELVEDLLDPLLPEIMNCLPDWPEVEAAAARSEADDRTSNS